MLKEKKCYWNLETNGVKMPFRNKKCLPDLFPWGHKHLHANSHQLLSQLCVKLYLNDARTDQ